MEYKLSSNEHFTISKNGTDTNVDEQLSKCTEITYADLVTLRNNSGLVAGMWYRITDYVTTTTQANTQSAGHVFDVIVRADDVNVINENAYAALHSGDTYFSTAGAKLEAWELKYCIDNDTNRFAWADSTNGKGVIWWMKDEHGNECPYDLKNIMFKWTSAISQSGIKANVFYYTFSVATGTDDATVTDHSLNGAYCYGNKMGVYISSNKQQLNSNVFSNTTVMMTCNSNTFGNNCYGNTFGNYCYGNTFGNYCNYNTFGNNYYNNTFGNNCYNNTFGYNCYSNTFGNYCQDNTFEDDCQDNTFENGCSSNTFENGLYNTRFDNETSNQHIDTSGTYINKAKEVFFNTDEIYQKKDNQIYPVSHPDLSTQPSILPQRFGNLEIKEVLIANGRENEIPQDVMIIEAFSFNKDACAPATCQKANGVWSISNPAGFTPEFTLIRYVGADKGYYYYSQGGGDEDIIKPVDFTLPIFVADLDGKTIQLPVGFDINKFKMITNIDVTLVYDERGGFVDESDRSPVVIYIGERDDRHITFANPQDGAYHVGEVIEFKYE